MTVVGGRVGSLHAVVVVVDATVVVFVVADAAAVGADVAVD